MGTAKPKTDELTDAAIERIRRESAERHAREPHAETVTYDAATDTLTVDLRGGSRVVTSAAAVKGLGNATEAQKADVRIRDGRALFWDSLDVQHTLIAFIADAFGVPTAKVIASKGGQAATEAKRAASRANGAKGGRPRKTPVKMAA